MWDKMKICGHCKFEKPNCEFNKNKRTKDKLSSWCKSCTKQYQVNNKDKIVARKKLYYKNNRETILEKDKYYRENNKEKTAACRSKYYENNKKEILINKKQYYENNKESLLEQAAEYYENNKDKVLEKRKQDYKDTKDETLIERKLYYENNKEKILEDVKKYSNTPDGREKIKQRRKKRRSTDIKHKLSRSLIHRLYKALKGNYKSGSAVRDLGCSIGELKMRLERQFEPGMTWENYGEWHIDHIIPISSFNLTDRMEFLEACNWCNLQPLWAADNIKKSNKLI